MSTESIDKILPFECSCGILHQIKIPVIELFKRREISTESIDDLREQLEEFALHIKPGTAKGKHRTAIFDTLELTKLVADLIKQSQLEARIDELNRYDTDKDMYKTLRTADLQNQVQAS